jgi:hypothetical protein
MELITRSTDEILHPGPRVLREDEALGMLNYVQEENKMQARYTTSLATSNRARFTGD